MYIPTRGHILAAAMATGLLFSPPTFAEDKIDGTVLLTVTGEVMNPNRGGFNPDTDKFFGYSEVEFAKAAQFDFDALESLATVKVNADFPKGEQVYEFEGPLLVDVLKAAGAAGETVTMQALDGYAIEVPLQELEDAGAVLALKRDGEAFGIGGFGPTQIVFPRADRADLSEMPDDNWIWSIFHISVK